MKYVKKPIEVEALQIHGNVSEIKEFIGENGDISIWEDPQKAGEGEPHTIVTIHTLEGDMRATDGDYIIKGVKGEFYPCRKDIFEETYESADRKQTLGWVYSLVKRRRTKEAEERGMTLIEYLESIDPLKEVRK